MPRLLNKKRPFGVVFGEDTHGVAYEQYGSFYNNAGKPVEWGTGKELPIDDVVVKPPPPKNDGGEFGDEIEVIDLHAWADRRAKYPFHIVQKEIQRKYSIFATTRAEAELIIRKETPVAA